MRYITRNGADRGLWLSFLIPLCLLPLTLKSQFVTDKFIFAIISWLSISQVIKQGIFVGKISVFDPRYLFHAILSIPASFCLSWIISYDIIYIYVLCLAAVLSHNYLISKLLVNCHGSFTFGEAQIVSQGVLLFVLCSINSLQMSQYHFHRSRYKEAMDLLMLLLLGLVFLIYFLNLVPALRKGIKFHFSCFGFAISMMLAWSYIYQQNVILWLVEFCTYKHTRVYLLLFWLILTLISVTFVMWVNQRIGSSASTLDRKFFHFIVNAVYISGVMYDVEFLCFASGIALDVYIVLEVYRLLDIPIIGKAIGQAFKIFLDEKDSGLLILTHIYLLIGCSSPIWLYSYFKNINDYHISLLSGIISVGFGDTFAAVGGTHFGKHFWKGSKKTIEGTVCAIFAQLICSIIFIYPNNHFSLFSIILVILSIVLTSILEAKTDQVDNLVLPLFMFSTLSWID